MREHMTSWYKKINNTGLIECCIENNKHPDRIGIENIKKSRNENELRTVEKILIEKNEGIQLQHTI